VTSGRARRSQGRAEVGGSVAPGYEAVEEEFNRNFVERGEIGAAFAAVRDGEPVVDLWGGTADLASGRRCERDTLHVIFSGTKALVGVCMLLLLERGAIELEAPVAQYWPEFAAAGKQDIRVSALVSHRAGLPGVRQAIGTDDFANPVRLAALLAAQEPLVEPGTLCYHPITFGWLCGELVRRVDGRSIGRFFAEEVAAPLGLDLWIGLPAEHEHRVARLELAHDWGNDEIPTPPGSVAELVVLNPPVWTREHFPWNRPELHAAEIAGAGGIGSSRALARLYACLARGGSLDEVRLLDEATVLRGRAELARGPELLGGDEIAFGIGFRLQDPARPFGPPEDAFGHSGAGGSMHGAWLAERVGFSYAMNLMRMDRGDDRARALIHALYRCVSDKAAR
jgi:CubicO group peptidase (beta-lactamase class C family)